MSSRRIRAVIMPTSLINVCAERPDIEPCQALIPEEQYDLQDRKSK